VLHIFGWQGGLAVWSIPATLSVVPLILVARRGARHRPPAAGSPIRPLLADSVAWRVTLFFALQASIVFSGLSWLPSILRSDGYAPGVAGALLAVYAIGGVPASLVVPVIAARCRDQRLIALGCAGAEAIAMSGLLLFPGAAPAAVVLFALAQGASFSLAVSLIALRSRDGRNSTQLSAMTQSIGYAVAAAGPLTFGLLHTATGNWTVPLCFLVALCLPMGIAGTRAGRAI
jgi:CP family cyanate transporter-like MFS transporter